MTKCFLILVTFPVLFYACNDDASIKAQEESYQATKTNLLEKEQKNPASFLVVHGQNKRNLLGQTVIRGVIKNNAKIATFKDVDLKLSFYSKTKALLETDKETVFEQLSPGQSKNFKTKYFGPKGTDSVALVVLGAKVVKE